MRAWQDEFHVAVSNKYGHERKFGTRERIHGTPKAVRKILDDIGAQNLLLKERELAVNELAQQNNAVLNQLQLTKFKIDDGLIRNDKKAEKLDEKRKELKLMEEQLKKMLATADEEIARLQKDKRQFMNEDNIDEAHKLHKQIESSEAAIKKIRQSISPRI